MNITHLKYAVEIARAGSINKAAETLLVGQPNLSRAIHELESTTGIIIFERSAKGMNVTPDGERFLRQARSVLKQMDELEAEYKTGQYKKQRFSVCACYASYVANAFAQLTEQITAEALDFSFFENNMLRTIDAVAHGECRLGIIRYATEHEKYVAGILEEKKLFSERLAKFKQHVLINSNNPLASLSQIMPEDLAPYIEIITEESAAGERSISRRRITLPDRAGRLELLNSNPNTFMLACPLPTHTAAKYGIVQKQYADPRPFSDIMICSQDIRLSMLEMRFIDYLRDHAAAM